MTKYPAGLLPLFPVQKFRAVVAWASAELMDFASVPFGTTTVTHLNPVFPASSTALTTIS